MPAMVVRNQLFLVHMQHYSKEVVIVIVMTHENGLFPQLTEADQRDAADKGGGPHA
jgi:hypothetical protein